MDKKPLIRKCLAVGIILLFVGIAYAPVINAIDESRIPKALSIPKKDDSVSITVLEFKADGTVEKSIVKMPCEQWMNYRAEIRDVRDVDTKLSVYKKYNLVPQNVTADTLRLGMEEKARRIYRESGPLCDLVFCNKSNNAFLGYFYRNRNCAVSGWMFLGLRFLGGLSFIISLINGIINIFYMVVPNFPPFLIPSIDLFQILIGGIGGVHAYNGGLPEWNVAGIQILIFLLGFVGYQLIEIPFPPFFLTFFYQFVGYTLNIHCYIDRYYDPVP